MKLSSRLLLLILVCLAPIVGAQLYTQYRWHQQQRTERAALAVRQVELANAYLASTADGLRQLLTAAAQFPEVWAAGPHCAEELSAVRRRAPAVRFFAVFDGSGGLLCRSRGAAQALQGNKAWVDELLADPGQQIGRFTRPKQGSAFVPLAIHPNRQHSPVALIVAAVDLDWLADHLRQINPSRIEAAYGSVLYVTDRDGVVIGRVPFRSGTIGRNLPPDLWHAVDLPRRVGRPIASLVDNAQLVAGIPAALPPTGLVAVESLPLQTGLPALLRSSWQEMLPTLVAALLALGLAWLTGRYFIARPTGYLLAAARRWQDGDLGARALRTRSSSEFCTLAGSFNAMASSLQARDLERRLQAESLEAQVAERTRALSDSNNRLQVEIAERAKTEAALHQSHKLQAVGQLAGGIAHDFNNMLATVLGSLELMERRVAQSAQHWTEADAERQVRLIQRATGAVLRGSQLTSRLLAFSKRQRLAPRASDLNRLVTDLATLAAPTLGRRIAVSTALAEDPWPALVDPSQVEAAILNCCLNARDAMPDGGTLTITTANQTVAPGRHPDDPPPGDYVRISIADTGSGMPPEVLQRAFDPFFTTKGPSGSGLGLSQVYGMARQSGGAVLIDSTPGKGTVVMLLLPRAATDAPPEPQRTITRPARNEPPTQVLLVDDDDAVRHVTVEMLRDLGCEVMQAAGGEEALALLESSDRMPELILLDYAMPEMNGMELARALRARSLRAPIALVTGYAELTGRETDNTQLEGFLRKPFTIRELDELLARLRRIAQQAGTPQHVA